MVISPQSNPISPSGMPSFKLNFYEDSAFNPFAHIKSEGR